MNILWTVFHVSASPVPPGLARILCLGSPPCVHTCSCPRPCPVFTLTVCPLPMFTHLSPFLHSLRVPTGLTWTIPCLQMPVTRGSGSPWVSLETEQGGGWGCVLASVMPSIL